MSIWEMDSRAVHKGEKNRRKYNGLLPWDKHFELKIFLQQVCQNVDLCELSMPCNNIFIMQLPILWLFTESTYIQPVQIPRRQASAYGTGLRNNKWSYLALLCHVLSKQL